MSYSIEIALLILPPVGVFNSQGAGLSLSLSRLEEVDEGEWRGRMASSDCWPPAASRPQPTEMQFGEKSRVQKVVFG